MKATVRISPNPDGTFYAMQWNGETLDYDILSPADACRLMQVEGTIVEVAMNHPTDPNSNLECRSEMVVI